MGERPDGTQPLAEAQRWAMVNLGSYSMYQVYGGYNDKIERSIVLEKVGSADSIPDEESLEHLRQVTEQKEIFSSTVEAKVKIVKSWVNSPEAIEAHREFSN